MTSLVYILIAGSRDGTPAMLDYARRCVRRAHQKGYVLLVGDNPKGVDRAVVREARRLRARTVVVGVDIRPRNGGYGEYIKISPDLYRGMQNRALSRFTVRDRYMVDMATRAVFIWNGTSPGTKAGYDYAVARGKEAHLLAS